METELRSLRRTCLIMLAALAIMWAINVTMDVLTGTPAWYVWVVRAFFTTVTIVGFVFVIRQGRRRLARQRRYYYLGPPEGAPQGLRAVLKDGSEVALTCVYAGPRGTHHSWAIQGKRPKNLDRLAWDVKPPNTFFTWYDGE